MRLNTFARHHMAHRTASYIPASESRILHNFAVLENDFGVSPAVRTAWKKLTIKGLPKYPDRNASDLTNAIARWLHVRPDMVALGNGSDELVSVVTQILVEPGSAVVVQTPTFFRIIEAIEKMKGNVVAVPALPQRNFALDMDMAGRLVQAASAHRAALLWVCSPDNPTGVPMNVSVLRWILTHTAATVIVDEAYEELADPENKNTAVRLLSDHPNLIVTKTFSKAFGLAGLRVGMMIGKPEIIRVVDSWRLNFPVSSISLALAAAALSDIHHLQLIHEKVVRQRKRIEVAVRKIPSLELGGQSQTNVIILRHKTGNLHRLLLKHGIMTADFNRMNGLEGMRFVRITVKRPAETSALIRTLKQIGTEDV